MLLALEKRLDVLLDSGRAAPEDEDCKKLYPYIWLEYDLLEDYEKKMKVDDRLREALQSVREVFFKNETVDLYKNRKEEHPCWILKVNGVEEVEACIYWHETWQSYFFRCRWLGRDYFSFNAVFLVLCNIGNKWRLATKIRADSEPLCKLNKILDFYKRASPKEEISATLRLIYDVLFRKYGPLDTVDATNEEPFWTIHVGALSFGAGYNAGTFVCRITKGESVHSYPSIKPMMCDLCKELGRDMIADYIV